MTYTDTLSTGTLSRFPKDQREVIRVALHGGWKGRVVSDGGVRLIPPDGLDATVTPLYVPMTKVDSSRVKGLQRAVLRSLADHTPAPEVVELAESLEAAGLDATKPITVEHHDALNVTILHQGEDDILTVAPYLARSSRRGTDASLYASSVVLTRTWRSGKQDYACSWEGCDYTATSPKSVASHYAAHRTRAIMDRTTVAVEVDAEPLYDTAVARLTREIEAALEEGSLDWSQPGAVASALAGRIVTARRARGEAREHRDDEPLTPEALLQRLRNLLLPQEIVNRENLAAQVSSLAAQVALLEEQNSRLVNRLGEKQSTLDTLAALIEDIRKEGEDEGDSQDNGPIAP